MPSDRRAGRRLATRQAISNAATRLFFERAARVSGKALFAVGARGAAADGADGPTFGTSSFFSAGSGLGLGGTGVISMGGATAGSGTGR